MSLENIPSGIYLIVDKPIIEHYGVLDIGNRLHLLGTDGSHPVVIHKHTDGIRAQWLRDTGKWKILSKVIDENGAALRIAQALQEPKYELFGSNCENFARLITEGDSRSTQVQAATFAGITLALAALLR